MQEFEDEMPANLNLVSAKLNAIRPGVAVEEAKANTS
jgi:hypothetical protein